MHSLSQLVLERLKLVKRHIILKAPINSFLLILFKHLHSLLQLVNVLILSLYLAKQHSLLDFECFNLSLLFLVLVQQLYVERLPFCLFFYCLFHKPHLFEDGLVDLLNLLFLQLKFLYFIRVPILVSSLQL